MTDITAEQVARAIAAVRENGVVGECALLRVLGEGWRQIAPEYVLRGNLALGFQCWHAKLVAAEAKAAGAQVWNAAYPPGTLVYVKGKASEQWHAGAVVPSVCGEQWVVVQCNDGEMLIREPHELHLLRVRAPEPAQPIDDTSPQRLRERREALGWTVSDARLASRIAFHCYVERCESTGHDSQIDAEDRMRYAVVLTMEEQRRAKEEEGKVPVWSMSGPPVITVPPGLRLIVNGAMLDAYAYVTKANDLVSAVVDPDLPAPEVAPAPQQEPWHARLVRLARDVQAAKEALGVAAKAYTAASNMVDEAEEALADACVAGAILEAAEKGGAHD